MEIAAAPVSPAPRTVEDIYKDFSNRRTALVRALTVDVDDFFGYCDPEKENLCLYGYSNGSWEVGLPAEEVPPEMPEPALGINFARDGMHRRDWLSLVAVHSDSWLLSVAFFFGARLNANERFSSYVKPPHEFTDELILTRAILHKIQGTFLLLGTQDCPENLSNTILSADFQSWKRLFSMINDQPTVLESLSERKHGRDNKSGVESSGKSRHSAKRANNDMQTKNSRPLVVDDAYEDDDEHSETLCGTCGGRYNASEFWIGCDICERWFHGKCVRITPAKAEHIKHYKCPDCSSKKGRQ